MTTTSFREAAERRVAELEQQERERKVAAEQRAAEQRAGQAAEADRRAQARQQQAEHEAAEARARLARRFGIAATQIVLAAEYYCFVVEHRDLAVAYTRGPDADRRTSWDHQARLQRVLNVGVDPPLIVTGAQILTYAEGVDRLAVDPTVDDLTNLTGASR